MKKDFLENLRGSATPTYFIAEETVLYNSVTINKYIFDGNAYNRTFSSLKKNKKI